jgi:hypothetical protein
LPRLGVHQALPNASKVALAFTPPPLKTALTSGWKQQRCCQCQTIYRYLFSRRTQRKAVPCPACGRIQPDAIGMQLARGHRRATWLGVGGIGLVWCINALAAAAVQLGQRPLPLPPYHFLPMACAAFGLLSVLAHLLVEANHPDALLLWNRARARRLLKKGLLAIDQQGIPASHRPPPKIHPAMGGLAVCLVGMASLMLAFLLPLVLGWPYNPHCYPPVVGPGDRTTLVMRSPVSLKLVGSNPGIEASDFEVTNFPSHIELEVANSQRLVGRTIHLELDGPQGATEQLSLALAPPIASELYLWLLCRLGSLIGIACLGLGGQLLVYASMDLTRRAHPINDIPLQDVPTPLKTG